MCAAMPTYAFAYFLPVLLRGMGFSAGLSQILSAPPTIFACAVGFGMAYLADKIQMRGPIIFVNSVICVVGLACTAYSATIGVRYFGTFLGLAGAHGNVPAMLSYQSNNIRMDSKRSVGSALQVGFGAIGGIIASTVFRTEDAPRYVPGLWATIGCQFVIMLLVAVMSVYFKIQNREQKNGKYIEGHPDFTYTL
jgi:MFS family permease